MMFIGVVGLIILPLFFWVCGRMVANSDFGKTAGGKTMEIFLYFFALSGLFSSILIIVNAL